MSRIPAPKTQRKTAIPTPRASVAAGRQIAIVKASDDQIEVPSALQKRVFKQALSQSAQQPGKKVRAVGSTRAPIPAPYVKTKQGKELAIQQLKVKKVVQRTPRGEYIGKTLTGIDVGPSGRAHKIEMTKQEIDPRFATESVGINATVSATSSLSVTASGKQIKKSFKKSTVIADSFRSKPNMNPHHLKRLVKEENEDVENTLKMVPPNLVSTSVDKFPMKKKIQKLRLSAAPMSLLTESVVNPTPTADEVDAEAPPEVLASVMDAVEKGASPDSAPNELFNSLFPEVEEKRIGVSSVAPGPLEDIVIPTSAPSRLVDEMLTQEMEDFLLNEIQNKEELPKDNICTESNLAAVPLSPGKLKDPLNIETEAAPWEDATVQKLSALVGAYPMNLLESSDFSALQSSDISKELSKGIDYILDADAVPYENKIQIRGSKLPKWFPGYMSAFPHLTEIVKISRTPSEVLHRAWKAVQPKVFSEDSVLLV